MSSKGPCQGLKPQVALPPPLPPPPPEITQPATVTRAPEPPVVPQQGPPGAFMIELLTFSGSPFNDHWAYWVSSTASPDVGLELHATGDVRNGFKLEIKRSYDLTEPGNSPTKRIPLQWIDGRHLDEDAMFNGGVVRFDDTPVCGLETSAFRIGAPGRSLNDATTSGQKVTQRDCQTWIVESARQLLEDGILNEDVVVFLEAIKQ